MEEYFCFHWLIFIEVYLIDGLGYQTDLEYSFLKVLVASSCDKSDATKISNSRIFVYSLKLHRKRFISVAPFREKGALIIYSECKEFMTVWDKCNDIFV